MQTITINISIFGSLAKKALQKYNNWNIKLQTHLVCVFFLYFHHRWKRLYSRRYFIRFLPERNAIDHKTIPPHRYTLFYFQIKPIDCRTIRYTDRRTKAKTLQSPANYSLNWIVLKKEVLKKKLMHIAARPNAIRT